MGRRIASLLFAAWAVAACATTGGAVAPAAEPSTAIGAETSAAPVAAGTREDRSLDGRFGLGPDAMSLRSMQQAPAPLAGEAQRAAAILMPTVTVVPTAYAVESLPTRPATAAELATLRGALGGWLDRFIAVVDGQRHPQSGADPGAELRNMFADPRLSTVIMRSLSLAGASAESTLTSAGWMLEGAVMRAWGSSAYADVAVNAVDHAATDRPVQWRLRVETNGSWYRVIDLREPVTGAWVLGTAPRYSALELQTELRNAVANYLSTESYSSFRPMSYAPSFADAPFFRARTAAINELNAAHAANTFRERYFENVSSSISLFRPAWFGGDGIVTVNVSGSVVETLGTGSTVTTAFVQQLKFLRGHDMWIAIDARNDDGSWASDGNLALAEVARPHG